MKSRLLLCQLCTQTFMISSWQRDAPAAPGCDFGSDCIYAPVSESVLLSLPVWLATCVDRTCGICVTFQYPVAWFLFSYFLCWFCNVSGGSKRRERGGTLLRCALARLREESQVTNQMRSIVCFVVSRRRSSDVLLRLGLWAVYLARPSWGRARPRTAWGWGGNTKAQRQPINQNIFIYITFRHSLIFILFSVRSWFCNLCHGVLGVDSHKRLAN